MLTGKSIVLGVSGSIAAYKAVYLTRLLVEAGAEVWPILTAAATRFVGPLTFAALTRHRPVTDMWSASEAGGVSHVELAHRASLLLLAPATADLLARLATGRADDPLAAVALATRAPWIIAPAMESGMWENPATVQNVAALRARGVWIVPPAEGALASGQSGIGRLADPEQIFALVLRRLGPQDLAGERILITAGPTRELFDPVRFISNPSTGKMGYALARVARRRGAAVHLISGPTQLTPPADVELTRVETTAELLTACEAQLPSATALLMAAAPADFRPRQPQLNKRPKATEPFTIELEPTPDVLRHLAGLSPRPLRVGFAAETDAVVEKAAHKLAAKQLDLIVANDVSRPDAGFAVDTNTVTLIGREGPAAPFSGSKEDVANHILDRVVRLLHPTP